MGEEGGGCFPEEDMFTRTTTLGPPGVLCCYSVSLWSIGHQVNETEDLAS